MHKSLFAVFFLTIFTITIVTPTIVMLVDDSMDVSMFYNITEEEEKKEKENDGKKELIFSNYINPESNYIGYKNTIVDHYNLKDYTTPHLNLILPPPEVHI